MYWAWSAQTVGERANERRRKGAADDENKKKLQKAENERINSGQTKICEPSKGSQGGANEVTELRKRPKSEWGR